jgi:hypothetical protein
MLPSGTKIWPVKIEICGRPIKEALDGLQHGQCRYKKGFF